MALPMQASGGRRVVFRRRTDSALATRLGVDMSKKMHRSSLPSRDNEPINANHCYLVGRKLPMRGASHCGASENIEDTKQFANRRHWLNYGDMAHIDARHPQRGAVTDGLVDTFPTQGDGVSASRARCQLTLAN
jgi:hypothetical protein